MICKSHYVISTNAFNGINKTDAYNLLPSIMLNKNLAYYTYLFEHLTVNKMRGQVAPHKPILLLAIMDLVECEMIMLPRIELREALIAAFKWNWVRLVQKDIHFNPVIGTPFYHMSGEPFWKLVPKDPSYAPNTTNVTTLREHYEYAEIDPELFVLMLDADARQHLRKVLIETYLTDHNQTPNENPSLIEIALEIALKAHKGQRDLDGKPVILHPLTVALKGNNEREIVAGLLHDVVEDTDWTFDNLLQAGISPEVVDALRLLTHIKDEPYLDYVRRIAASRNRIAINVKSNDLDHNLARGRKGDHLKQVAKHTAARKIIHPINGDEDAAWDLLLDDPEEGKFWQAKFAFQIKEQSIEEATAQAGITIDEYMHFFHPGRTDY